MEDAWRDRLIALAGDVRNVWHLVGLCVVAGIVLGVAVSEWLAFISFATALAALAFAAATGDHGTLGKRLGSYGTVKGNEPVAPYPVEAHGAAADKAALMLSVSPIEKILFKHLSSDRENLLGSYGEVRGRYFVNLREAALVPSQLRVLVDEFGSFVRRTVDVSSFHIVATPRRGNVVLGVALAEELGLAPMLVSDVPKNGEWVETPLASGRVMVVDDVHTTAGVLADTVLTARGATGLKRLGYLVTHVFVLIERTEGNLTRELTGGREEFAEAPVQCHAFMRMGDMEFAALVEKVRTS